MPEVRQTVRPRWVFRLPGGAPDGVLRRRGGVLERLVHVDDEPVVVRVAQPGARARSCSARAPRDRDTADEAIARMRFALGVDDDLRPFHDRFRRDPLIGASVRARAVAADPPPPRAVRGARVGDHRAAHRVRARRRDPAADRAAASAGAAPRTGLRDLPAAGARRRARRPRCCSRSTSPPAARDRAASAPRARSRRAASTCAPPTTSAAGGGCARSRASGAWTIEMLAPARPGPLRPAPGRRPRPTSSSSGGCATRQPARARDRGRGARVLRPLRGVGRARRHARGPRRARPRATSTRPRRAGTRSSARAPASAAA